MQNFSVEETLELLEAICKIPAPTHHEQKRAAYCKDWLEKNGAENVYLDCVNNVIFPMNCENRDDIVLFLAHTDTVFPDLNEPMPYHRQGNRIYSPGVGDNAICLAMMLISIKHLLQNKCKPRCGILFVANACEEGLGNLKGVAQILNDYAGKIKCAYTFDGRYDELICKCVGSHRYRINIETEGGHSFTAFGKKNAICAVAELICRLDQCDLPYEQNSKTTFNFGVIEGGTSVNTIAQNATFLYEYRSDSKYCLEYMKHFFEESIKRTQMDPELRLSVETIGVRPCGNIEDQGVLEQMILQCKEICEKNSGMECALKSGSTDANLPMSMGIPAICVGTYQGGGMHTREEYLEIESVPIGLKITYEVIAQYFS